MEHGANVDRQLAALGLTRWERPRRLSAEMGKYLTPNERILSAVAGFDEVGNRIVLLATFSRLVWAKRVPLFNSIDEVSYYAVTGIRCQIGAIWRSVVEVNFGENSLVLHGVRTVLTDPMVRTVQRLATLAKVEVQFGGLAPLGSLKRKTEV